MNQRDTQFFTFSLTQDEINNHPSEPKVDYSDAVYNPVFTIEVNNQSIHLSTKQARILFGKLGKFLEKVTPDDDILKRELK
jgi:hypothetical protein